MRRDFARPTARLARRLGRLHDEVRGFDRWLKALAERLTLALVDSALLREVVYAVQQEHAAGAVHVDEIRYGDIPADVRVEVFRTDLVIVLKNVVRNAILAMAEEPPRRALGLEVRVEPEPTGDESVAIVVSDTSPQVLTTEAIYERKLDRGLGLVTAALDRYNGSIAVEAGKAGFAKSVALRFFRAM
jgi:C4-dicarboxylate-specific signal transduction histidine kinase